MLTINARKKRTALVAVATVVMVAVGAIAFAYWTSSGTGSGSGQTAEGADFTVSSTPATGAELEPGGGDQSAAFVVTNPSGGVQTLADVTVTVAMADGTAWVVGDGDPLTIGDDCSAADFEVDDAGVTYGSMLAGATVDGSVAFRMLDSGANQDGCKDIAVPLYLVAS
jgi:hypothetical protein